MSKKTTLRAFYTTPQKTFILSLTKKTSHEQQIDPVFTYIVSSIGETLDTNRFSIADNDLIEMTKEFRIFMLDKNDFNDMSIDRCKIIKFETILKNTWFIEDYWTEEEKVALGLKKEILILDNESIEDEIEQTRKTLNKIKKQINKDYSDKKYTPFKLDEIIDFSIMTNDSSFTKTFVNENKGNIPVFSASKDHSHSGYGLIKDNLNNVKYFEDCLTWNIDGSIGKAHYRNGKFSLSEKVIPLIIKIEYRNKIDYMYLKYAIENTVLKMGFNFLKKAGKGKIKSISIPIPINSNNVPDIKTQKTISSKYKQIQELKVELKNHMDKLMSEYENDLMGHVF